ncbi:hypothetical protein EJC49_07205 [Aquibium carbonis]|uniref:Uncharacterized protein n=1 Tax=Aquibium carbonis TaxID=2495581 RepID=A0A3R9Y9B5_9HYPH|nr:hypothetical protein [Aquibium carbonis]RST87050.1 hypothetical protein EJC49_07205 [Aquibium carbonis]
MYKSVAAFGFISLLSLGLTWASVNSMLKHKYGGIFKEIEIAQSNLNAIRAEVEGWNIDSVNGASDRVRNFAGQIVNAHLHFAKESLDAIPDAILPIDTLSNTSKAELKTLYVTVYSNYNIFNTYQRYNNDIKDSLRTAALESESRLSENEILRRIGTIRAYSNFIEASSTRISVRGKSLVSTIDRNSDPFDILDRKAELSIEMSRHDIIMSYLILLLKQSRH